MSLPTEAKARKNAPIYRGCMLYFPDALAAVAELSRIGNEQHNPGQPMHWSRDKSTDHGDCIARHQIDVGKLDTDGVRHATKVAWRALAQLQIELEDAAKKIPLNVSTVSAASADVPVRVPVPQLDVPHKRSRWVMERRTNGIAWTTEGEYTLEEISRTHAGCCRVVSPR